MSAFLIKLETGVKRDLLDTVEARKLAYYGHTMRKQGSCLEEEIVQGTMPDAPTHGLDGQHQDVDRTPRIEESIKMTEDRETVRDKWSKHYVKDVAPPLD